MKSLTEALENADKIRIFDLQKDIIDIQIRLVDADGSDEKERMKNEIQALKDQIQSIKDSAE